MNPREQADNAFDKLVAATLLSIERGLLDFDPDELEAVFSGDVLNISLADGTRIVINRQRAVRQIWMAALRRAWHFDLVEQAVSTDPGKPETALAWKVASTGAELFSTVETLLTERLKRPVVIPH